MNAINPKSVIRSPNDYVLLSCRLTAVFVEGVADYVEAKRQTICRQEGVNVGEAWHKPQNKNPAV